MAERSGSQKDHTGGSVIPYGKQHIGAQDIRAVVSALRSPRITQGPLVDRFEEALSKFCGAKYAVAVSNGTAALHLACLAAGIGPGDEVITSPITFLATSNAVLYVNATPIFADIDADTANISAATIEKVISPKTKAILVVHMGGQPANMPEISRLAKKHGLIVIEDACHALGAESQGKKTGSCDHSDMAIYSFHPVKLITTGEGGAITTNDLKIQNKLKSLRSHGVVRSADLSQKNGGWYYEMRDLGYNYRLTDIQCALGIAQMKQVNWFLGRRTQIAENYNRAFASLGSLVKLPSVAKGDKHAWHLYVLRTRSKASEHSRRNLYDYLLSKQIQTQVHYIPVYRQPYYQKRFKLKTSDYPNAEQYYREAISLPIFPDLSRASSAKVVRAIKDFFEK